MRQIERARDYGRVATARVESHVDHKTTYGDTRAYTPVCRKLPSRTSRETAGLSGWPSSEPDTAEADGRVLRYDPSVCGTCSEDAPLSRNFPKRCPQRSCASEGWGVREVLRRHRKVDKEGLPKRAPISRAFRWPEQYGHFRRGRYSNEAVQCAFRCPLEKAFFLRAAREDGRL